MTTQPEALRHPDKLDAHEFDEPHGAAAELRRLNEAYECNTAIMHARTKRMNELLAQRDALLEACKTLVSLPGTEDWAATLRLAVQQARAAIKAVEGK